MPRSDPVFAPESRNSSPRSSTLEFPVRLQEPVSWPAWARALLRGLLVAIGYYLATRIGFLLTPYGHPIAAFWPPNAILFAGLLVTEYKNWPWLLVPIIPAHLAAQLPIGVPLSTAMGWLGSNAAEALFGAYLLRRLVRRDKMFRNVRSTTIFLIFGALLPPLVTSFFDAGVVVLTKFGTQYWSLWMTRLFSNVLADLTIIPIVVELYYRDRLKKAHGDSLRVAERIVLWTLLVSTCGVIFSSRIYSATYVPLLSYVPFPLLLWAAVRFGPGMLSAATLTVTLAGIWSALHGLGPFGLGSTVEHVLSLQIFICLLFVPLLLLCSLMYERRSLVYSLWLSRGKIVRAQEEERSHIAREIHDDFGQRLTSFQLGLHEIGTRCPPNVREDVDALRADMSGLMNDMRSMSHSLHPHLLELAGLRVALTEQCARLRKSSAIGVTLTFDDSTDTLPIPLALCAYRIVQEALTNVEKHSGAQDVSIGVQQSATHLTVTVEDNGRGFSSRDKQAGMGLVSMHERVSSLGGRLRIASEPGHGTSITLSLPLAVSDGESVA